MKKQLGFLLIALTVLSMVIFFTKRNEKEGFWDEIYQGCLKTSPKEQCACVFENIKKNYRGKETQFIYDMENDGVLDSEFARCHQELSAYSY